VIPNWLHDEFLPKESTIRRVSSWWEKELLNLCHFISADELNSQLSKQIYELTIRVIKTSDIWRQEVDQELQKQWNLLKPKLQCESTKEEYDDFKYDFVAQYTDEVKELTLEMSQDPGYVNQSRQKCAYYRDSSERIGRQLKFS
jgi:hypothetical protein